MCTIVALVAQRPDFPLVLATNRDEFYARPTAGPGLLLEAPKAIGGRDLLAGGTWMGVSEAGLFVGVTNQRSSEGRDPSKLSRGELVLASLRLGEPEAIARHLETLDARRYNPCNLMFGTAEALFVAYARADAAPFELVRVAPGLHVLPNDRLDSPDFVKVGRAQALIAPHVDAPFPELAAQLKRALADRLLPELDAIPQGSEEATRPRELLRELAALCVRTPAYGTRSSTVVALAPGRVGHYLYADGPPDQTPFADVTGLYGTDLT